MLNLDQYQNKIKYLLIALAAIVVVMIIVIALRMDREDAAVDNIQTGIKNENQTSPSDQLKELDKLRSAEAQEVVNQNKEDALKELDSLRKKEDVPQATAEAKQAELEALKALSK